MGLSALSGLQAFAEEVGAAGPVAVRGAGTQWHLGGFIEPAVRTVVAPAGIASFSPEEMIVAAGAGTPLADLHAVLAERGQTTVLEDAPASTVGGALAVGRSGLRRLRLGPVCDALLQARYVAADGRVVTAGGPTVKNVTGYDLCRLLVGSYGTLGFLGEVLLRTRPRPVTAQWWAGPAAAGAVAAALYRPSSMLTDGTTTWVLLEGHPGDVAAEGRAAAALGLREAAGPPPLPPVRSSVPAGALAEVLAGGTAGRCVVEWGVGVVHGERPLPRPTPAPEVVALHRRLKQAFDPAHRLNPGCDPLLGAGGAA
jgi:FAD/FMN-containing dehydrogenase